MIWDILEKKLMDAALLVPAIPGQTLFRHTMPADATKGVMFKNPLSGIPVDPYLPGFHKPSLQAIVRHVDPEEGDLLSQQVIDALQVDEPEDYPETDKRGRVRIHVFYPNTLPIQFPRLTGNGFEWSLNFTTAFAIQRK